MIGTMVLVRTLNAGVHFGMLTARDARSREVVLAQSRRIWEWDKANTLNEISLYGCTGKIAEAIPEGHIICEVIEIIPLQPAAVKQLATVVWKSPKP